MVGVEEVREGLGCYARCLAQDVRTRPRRDTGSSTSYESCCKRPLFFD